MNPVLHVRWEYCKH